MGAQTEHSAGDFIKNDTNRTLPEYEDINRNCIDGSTLDQPPIYPSPVPTVRVPEVSEYKPLPSDLKTKSYNNTTFSSDLRLNTDPELLKSFFYFSNTRPRMWVDIEGVEYEIYEVEVSTQKLRTSLSITRETRTRKKIRFKVSLEVTPYITEKGFVHFASSDARTDNEGIVSIYKEYVNNKSKFKSIKIKSKVVWDSEDLSDAIKSLIHSTGFQHSIKISYRFENNSMEVASSSLISNVARPISQLYGNKQGQQLRCCFPLSITTEEWVQENRQAIMSTVNKSCQ